jgi:hypothetical protein
VQRETKYIAKVSEEVSSMLVHVGEIQTGVESERMTCHCSGDLSFVNHPNGEMRCNGPTSALLGSCIHRQVHAKVSEPAADNVVGNNEGC